MPRKRRWRQLSLPLRAVLVVVGGLLLGLAAAVTGFGSHVARPLAQAGCTVTTGPPRTATIVLGTGVTTLQVQSSDELARRHPRWRLERVLGAGCDRPARVREPGTFRRSTSASAARPRPR